MLLEMICYAIPFFAIVILVAAIFFRGAAALFNGFIAPRSSMSPVLAPSFLRALGFGLSMVVGYFGIVFVAINFEGLMMSFPHRLFPSILMGIAFVGTAILTSLFLKCHLGKGFFIASFFWLIVALLWGMVMLGVWCFYVAGIIR